MPNGARTATCGASYARHGNAARAETKRGTAVPQERRQNGEAGIHWRRRDHRSGGDRALRGGRAGAFDSAVRPAAANARAALAERHAIVEVAANNQEVASRSELVFLAVRPQVAAEVLAALKFRPTQQVASFIATLDSAEIARRIRPAALVARVAPVPPVAQRKGPIAMCPPNEQLAELFGPISTLIQVSDEAQLDAFFSASAMMAPYFELLESVSAWLRAQGVEAAQADTYTGALFPRHRGKNPSSRPAKDSRNWSPSTRPAPASTSRLRRELLAAGFYDRIKAGLDLIQARMQGRATLKDTLQPNKP